MQKSVEDYGRKSSTKNQTIRFHARYSVVDRYGSAADLIAKQGMPHRFQEPGAGQGQPPAPGPPRPTAWCWGIAFDRGGFLISTASRKEKRPGSSGPSGLSVTPPSRLSGRDQWKACNTKYPPPISTGIPTSTGIRIGISVLLSVVGPAY